MKKITLSIFFVLIFFIASSYANNEIVFNSDSKTIKELKNDLKDIKKQEKNVVSKLEDFIKDSELKEYIENDLTVTEFKNLENIFGNYNKEKLKINEKLINTEDLEKIKKLKQELLDLKIRLYKKLVSYIKLEKHNSYLKYIRSDSEIVAEKNKIETKKIETENLVNKKVEVLEKKIKEQKKNLEIDLKNLVENKVEEKLNYILKKKKFTNLEPENKLIILSITYDKVDEKLQKAKEKVKKEKNILFEESIKQEIKVYKITLNKIQIFKEKLKELKL